jgi:hypothetical protein
VSGKKISYAAIAAFLPWSNFVGKYDAYYLGKCFTYLPLKHRWAVKNKAWSRAYYCVLSTPENYFSFLTWTSRLFALLCFLFLIMCLRTSAFYFLLLFPFVATPLLLPWYIPIHIEVNLYKWIFSEKSSSMPFPWPHLWLPPWWLLLRILFIPW